MQPNEEQRATGHIEEIGQRDHGHTSEYRIFGPPGTGKTTSLTRQIRRAADRYGADHILVTSFSRAAAAELAGRDLPIAPDRVGTLHSHCYHALGGPEIAEANVEEWNKDHLRYAITPQKKHGRLDGEEAGEETDEQEKGGDELLQRLGRFRGMMLDPQLWPPALREFDGLWTRYKRENGLLDFTDLIETALRDLAVAPRNPSVIFADEAQDLNRMQLSLVRKWGERAEYFIICGDDDQCQPPGTMVRTTGGDVPIELLDPGKHRLMSLAAQEGFIYGSGGKGYGFRKAVRDCDWRLHTVSVGDRLTRCTSEHRFCVRWVKGEALDRAHVVYLMQRGDRFRVGWCKLIRSDGIFHLGARSRHERAEAAWVLKVCYDRTEASIYESYIAAKYGLPLATFEPMKGAAHYTTESLGQLYQMLGPHLPLRAAHCLLDHGRDPRFPLYTPARAAAKRGGSTTFLTEATNLVPGIMSLPIPTEGRTVKWLPLAITTAHYSGPVYSLEVERHHTYIADGIVTHNCIYGFSGATPEAFLHPAIPDDHKIVLKQSYRVPRAVHQFAEELIQRVAVRQPKQYLPRDAGGAMYRYTGKDDTYKHIGGRLLADAERHLAEGKTVMFLASCSYMLRPLVQVLRKAGIPFHNPYRTSNGFWNPLRIGRRTTTASRILSLLVGHPDYGEDHRPWTNGDLAQWAEALQAKGVLRHGVKAKLKAADHTQTVTMEHLDAIFEPAAFESLMTAWDRSHRDLLAWWRARVTPEMTDRVKYPMEIAARRGARALLETPRVVVGTIHSVKGGQAEVVYLFPDLSQAGGAQYARGGAARDSVIRLFYVGATRARETLYVCQRETGMAVSI